MVLILINRISPYENISMQNSMWLSFGPLVKQPITNIRPKSTSARMASSVWSFFTLILVSSYTANLAAFVTVQRLKVPIESVEILSRQTEVKYGCILGGSTEHFFRVSFIKIYFKKFIH